MKCSTIVSFLTLSGFSSALDSNEVGSPQLSLTDTICDGRPRDPCEIELDVPESCVPIDGETDPACPIVFYLHPHSGNNNHFKYETGVHDVGYIGIYPQGDQQRWNTGPQEEVNNCTWDVFDCDSDPDEGDFIAAIIAEVRNQGATGNVYAIGTSNGAALAHRLASNAGDELPIKGIVAMVTPLIAFPERSEPGVLNYNQPRDGTSAVSVLSIMGTDDDYIPYDEEDGNSVIFKDYYSDFRFMTALDSMDYWASHNGCDISTRTADGSYTTGDMFDGTAVKYEYPDCPQGIIVEHYEITGGGHNSGTASINGEPITYDVAYNFIGRLEHHGSDSDEEESCVDDPDFVIPSVLSSWYVRVVREAGDGCGFAAFDPDKFCRWSDQDGTLVLRDACPVTCDHCSADPSCDDDPKWVVTDKSKGYYGRGCNYFATYPEKFCKIVDGIRDACISTCDNCPLSCDNDPAWAGKYDSSHGCDFVAAMPERRCNFVSSDGTLASDACPGACNEDCQEEEEEPVRNLLRAGK